MARKHFNLTPADIEYAQALLDRLNELRVDPINFLSDAVRAEEELPGDRRAYSGQNLVDVVSQMVPRRSGGMLDEAGYHGPLDPSPWHSPTIQSSLYALRFNLPLLAEVLREIANEIDPPEKKAGRPAVPPIEAAHRRSATLRLAITRWSLARARRGDELALEDPRIREALALRLDANETSAVLAFAKHTGFTGPLSRINVEKAHAYFERARSRSGRAKTQGFALRQKKTTRPGSVLRKGTRQCPDSEIPNVLPEPASPPTSRRSSSAAPSSPAPSASPKGSSDSRKPAATGRRRSASGIASSSTSSQRSSNGSAATRPAPPNRTSRRRSPDEDDPDTT